MREEMYHVLVNNNKFNDNNNFNNKYLFIRILLFN